MKLGIQKLWSAFRGGSYFMIYKVYFMMSTCLHLLKFALRLQTLFLFVMVVHVISRDSVTEIALNSAKHKLKTTTVSWSCLQHIITSLSNYLHYFFV